MTTSGCRTALPLNLHPLSKILCAHYGVRVEFRSRGKFLVAILARNLHPPTNLLLWHNHLFHLLHFDLLHGFPSQLSQAARLVLVVLTPPLHLLNLRFHLRSGWHHLLLLLFYIEENRSHWFRLHPHRLLLGARQPLIALSLRTSDILLSNFK